MRKDDWLKLAMPASIALLASAIFAMPYVVKSSGMMSVEGTMDSMKWPIYVRVLD